MAKDHGSSVKNDEQYEGLRKKGMSKTRAAAIANSEGASSRGGKKSGSGSASKSDSSQGGTTSRKRPPAARAAKRQPTSHRAPAQPSIPVAVCGVPTGLDSGEPRWRR